jgi:hypothetical protein
MAQREARFQAALTLPGSGIKKDRAKPAELSTGEKQAAYFNCAVAHGALGEVDDGLEAIEMAFRCGYGACPRSIAAVVHLLLCLPQSDSKFRATGDWVRHGTAQAIQDYNLLTESEELAPLRASPAFEALLDRYKLVPSRLAVELDFSSSALGRFAAANNSGFKAKP